MELGSVLLAKAVSSAENKALKPKRPIQATFRYLLQNYATVSLYPSSMQMIGMLPQRTYTDIRITAFDFLKGQGDAVVAVPIETSEIVLTPSDQPHNQPIKVFDVRFSADDSDIVIFRGTIFKRQEYNGIQYALGGISHSSDLRLRPLKTPPAIGITNAMQNSSDPQLNANTATHMQFAQTLLKRLSPDQATFFIEDAGDGYSPLNGTRLLRLFTTAPGCAVLETQSLK